MESEKEITKFIRTYTISKKNENGLRDGKFTSRPASDEEVEDNCVYTNNGVYTFSPAYLEIKLELPYVEVSEEKPDDISITIINIIDKENLYNHHPTALLNNLDSVLKEIDRTFVRASNRGAWCFDMSRKDVLKKEMTKLADKLSKSEKWKVNF